VDIQRDIPLIKDAQDDAESPFSFRQELGQYLAGLIERATISPR
jgi:hypothetical protein